MGTRKFSLVQESIKDADLESEAAQKKLQQMGSGKLKAAGERVQELGMKLASLKGDQDSLSDSVKVCISEGQEPPNTFNMVFLLFLLMLQIQGWSGSLRSWVRG